MPHAATLNATCACDAYDKAALRAAIEQLVPNLFDRIEQTHTSLFANRKVFLSTQNQQKMAAIIAAVETVLQNSAWRAHILAWAPAIAHGTAPSPGAFIGFDFHIEEEKGPQLIEINTNAGGAILNALLQQAQQQCCKILPSEQIKIAASSNTSATETAMHEPQLALVFVEMLTAEWRAVRGTAPLKNIAIIDVEPEKQFLYPEFLLLQKLLEQSGYSVVIADPEDLKWQNGRLWCGKNASTNTNASVIDLVINRLTDFSLSEPAESALRAAYIAGAVVLTPHPHAHALYADKRNLLALTDENLLQRCGIDEATCKILISGIPHTELVTAQKADDLWARRRTLFFKPATGYGSKAAYRGDKLTRRVFGEILQRDYIAQELIAPSVRKIDNASESAGGAASTDSGTNANATSAWAALKIDIRCYAYRGIVQLWAARLWQGQTANFRTPGGGFAAVIAVDSRAELKHQTKAELTKTSQTTAVRTEIKPSPVLPSPSPFSTS